MPTENLVPFAHQAEAKGSELAKELLEVIVSTGGDIARLASDTADFIEDYKTTQELEVHAIPAIDEQVAIDEEMISPINDMIPKDSFWNEVIDMHEEVSR